MNTQRLLILAEFLDKLKPEQFNFRWLVDAIENQCGTVCCAAGWLPVAFPDDFVWYGQKNGNDFHVDAIQYELLNEELKTGKYCIPLSYSMDPSTAFSIRIFFDLEAETFEQIFMPFGGDLAECGRPTRRLLPTATAHEVADHIRNIINLDLS